VRLPMSLQLSLVQDRWVLGDCVTYDIYFQDSRSIIVYESGLASGTPSNLGNEDFWLLLMAIIYCLDWNTGFTLLLEWVLCHAV
jgi:hypothetical protein